MYLPLSDLCPLRNTTVWGAYRNYQALPIGYGVVTFMPIAYDAAGLVFHLLDHPIQAVDEVGRNNLPEQGYRWRNDLDATGKAVSLLQLNEPLKVNEKLTVRVRGKMHPHTGALLLNPADVSWDFLANVCGLPIIEQDMDDFRLACLTAGIELHGLVNDATRTIRAQVDEFMVSAGAVWAGGMPGLARLYP